jgi:hypothetical protein
MANLYFEDLEIGTNSTAGPYLVSKSQYVGEHQSRRASQSARESIDGKRARR